MKAVLVPEKHTSSAENSKGRQTSWNHRPTLLPTIHSSWTRSSWSTLWTLASPTGPAPDWDGTAQHPSRNQNKSSRPAPPEWDLPASGAPQPRSAGRPPNPIPRPLLKIKDSKLCDLSRPRSHHGNRLLQKEGAKSVYGVVFEE